MPRWHFFLDFLFLRPLSLFFFFFGGCSLSSYSRSDETPTSRERKLRETREDSLLLLRTGDSVPSLLPGRRTVNRCIRDTKEREIRDLSVLSFGHLFVLWSTFSCSHFFRFFTREEEKTPEERIFFSFARKFLSHTRTHHK